VHAEPQRRPQPGLQRRRAGLLRQIHPQQRADGGDLQLPGAAQERRHGRDGPGRDGDQQHRRPVRRRLHQHPADQHRQQQVGQQDHRAEQQEHRSPVRSGAHQRPQCTPHLIRSG
jgi:hypothetical protein